MRTEQCAFLFLLENLVSLWGSQPHYHLLHQGRTIRDTVFNVNLLDPLTQMDFGRIARITGITVIAQPTFAQPEEIGVTTWPEWIASPNEPAVRRASLSGAQSVRATI